MKSDGGEYLCVCVEGCSVWDWMDSFFFFKKKKNDLEG